MAEWYSDILWCEDKKNKKLFEEIVMWSLKNLWIELLWNKHGGWQA